MTHKEFYNNCLRFTSINSTDGYLGINQPDELMIIEERTEEETIRPIARKKLRKPQDRKS